MLRIVAILLIAARASAEPMTLASDDVCELLKSDRHDRCKQTAHDGSAAIYRAGSKKGIIRYVLAIDRGDDIVVSPAIDLEADTKAQLHASAGSIVMELEGKAIVTCNPGTWKCDTRRLAR